jgi:hypothetical protein
MAENPFAGLRSLIADIQPPAGPRPSNAGTMYEGRSFGTRERGPQPTSTIERPDLNAPAAPAAPPSAQMGPGMAGWNVGVEGFKEINFSAVAALGQVFGMETVRKWGLENAEAASRRAQDFMPRIAKIEDVGGVRDAGEYILFTLGQLAPFALESAATAIAGAVIGGAIAGPGGAGAGAIAGVGRGGAVKEAIKATARGTATATQQQVARQAMAKLGATVGVAASGYKTGFGDVYNETVEGGDPSPGLAAVMAAPYAALDTLPELVLVNKISKIFGREGAQEVARGLIQRVGIGAVKQALLEGGGESGQEALLILARRAVQPGYDPTGAETKSRLLNAAAAGAIGGGVVGGATAAFDTGAPAAATPGAPAATPPGAPVGDVPLDTLEAQPQAPQAAGIPAFGGATQTATASPLMSAGQAPQPPAVPLAGAAPVAPEAPVEPMLDTPPVTAGMPPEQLEAGPLPPVTAAPESATATPAPVTAGMPGSPTDDAAGLLEDPEFAAATAELGSIVQPETASIEAVSTPAVVAKPKKKQSKEQRRKAYKDANQFKAFLSEYGVSMDAKLDILGDRKAPNPPVPFGKGPIFRKNGMGLDELASYAMQLGFITEQQMNDPTDNGAVRLLADMIRQQMNGEGNLQTITGLEDDLNQMMDPGVEGLMREAADRGIPTEGRSPAEVDEDVKRAQARDLGVEPDGMSLEEVDEAVEQAEVNRLMAEAAEDPSDVIAEAMEMDPDARIAIAMQLDEDAVERAARTATDDVDFWNRIEGIIDAGRGRDDQPAAGGADADAASGSGARGDADSGVSGSSAESGEGGDDAARPGDRPRREDEGQPDPDERAGAEPDSQRGGPDDAADAGAGADTLARKASRKKVKAELEALAAPKDDGIKFGDPLGKFSFDLPAGKVDVEATWASGPESYKEIYGEDGGIISFALRGAIDSETGYRSVAGVIYQGTMSPERVEGMARELAEKHAAKPGKPKKSRGDGKPALELEGETPDELKAKAEREAKVQAEVDAAERKARKKEKAANDKKSDKRQADATVGDFKLGQTANQQLTGPDLLDADPLSNNYAALEGKTVVQTVQMDGGKSATLKMDAAKALRGFDDRLAALKALGTCIASPR